MNLNKEIVRKHNLFEKYKDKCIDLLPKYNLELESGEYTASLHDKLLSLVDVKDLSFYKAKPRGNLISCKYISSKIDEMVKTKLQILKDKYDIKDSALHIIRTEFSDDSVSFISSIQKKLTKLGIGYDIIDIKNFEDLSIYIDSNIYSKNPFIVVKPLSEIFSNNLDDIINEFRVLNNYIERDIDCFTEINSSIRLEDALTFNVPTAVASVVEILKEFNISTKDYMHVCVLGQSKHLGRPMANIIEYNKFPTYTANSRTSKHIKEALFFSSDIVISMTGSRDICKMFNKYSVSTSDTLYKHMIIDVGIVKENDKIRGDIPDDIKAQYSIYNKVPGGVGLIDTSILALRVVKSYYTQNIK